MTQEGNQKQALLGFTVGPYYFCARAVEVQSIITPPSTLRTIPGSPFWVAGMFAYRNDIAVAVSLRAKFGLPEDTLRDSGQLIVAPIEGGLKAFWVDGVLETINVESLVWKPMTPLAPSDAFEKFALRDKTIYLYSTFQRLFNAEARGLTKTVNTLTPATLLVATDNREKESGSAAPKRQEHTLPIAAKCAPTTMTPVPPELKTSVSTEVRPKPTAAIKRPRRRRVRPSVHSTQRKDTATIQKPRRATSRPIPVSPAPLSIQNYTKEPPIKREGLALAVTMLGGIIAIGVALWPYQDFYAPPTTVPTPSYDTSLPYAAYPQSDQYAEFKTDTTSSLEENYPADHEGNGTPTSEVLRVEAQDFILTIERPHENLSTEAATSTALREGDQRTNNNSSQGSHEFIHVVTRGDTLWHIAQHYLDDPFRYPQLAKLSRIRDPDLIFPGDIIRIIHKTRGR